MLVCFYFHGWPGDFCAFATEVAERALPLQSQRPGLVLDLGTHLCKPQWVSETSWAVSLCTRWGTLWKPHGGTWEAADTQQVCSKRWLVSSFLDIVLEEINGRGYWGPSTYMGWAWFSFRISSEINPWGRAQCEEGSAPFTTQVPHATAPPTTHQGGRGNCSLSAQCTPRRETLPESGD